MAYKTEFGDYDEMYSGLPVDGAVVLDIGADYGTTAEYFLGRGARKVYCSERRAAWIESLHNLAKERPEIEVIDTIAPETAEDVLYDLRPDVVKMDCEKCERFFLGASDRALVIPKAWVVETHTERLYEAFLATFRALGYDVKTVEEFPDNPPERCIKVILATRGGSS